jgi:hypothetical protein
MLILDIGGNLFGGFTLLQWESPWPYAKWKCDDSLKTFLSTLKNLCNILAKKFALRADANEHAIYCYSAGDPEFDSMHVSGHCNTNNDSSKVFIIDPDSPHTSEIRQAPQYQNVEFTPHIHHETSSNPAMFSSRIRRHFLECPGGCPQ